MAANLREWIYDVVVHRKAKAKVHCQLMRIDYNANEPASGARAVVHDKVHLIAVHLTPSAIRSFEEKSNGKKIAALKTYFVTLRNFTVRVSSTASDVYLEVGELSIITDAGGSLIGHPRSICQDRTVREILRSLKALPPSHLQTKTLSELLRVVAEGASEPPGIRPLKELTNDELVPPWEQMQFVLHNHHWPQPPDFDLEERIAAHRLPTPPPSPSPSLSSEANNLSPRVRLDSLEVSARASQSSPNSSLPFRVHVVEDEGKEKGVRVLAESQFALSDSDSEDASGDRLRLSQILEGDDERDGLEKEHEVASNEKAVQYAGDLPKSMAEENDKPTQGKHGAYDGEHVVFPAISAAPSISSEVGEHDEDIEQLPPSRFAPSPSPPFVQQAQSLGPTPPVQPNLLSESLEPSTERQEPTLAPAEGAKVSVSVAASEEGPGLLTQMLNVESQSLSLPCAASPERSVSSLREASASSSRGTTTHDKLFQLPPVEASPGVEALGALVDMVMASPNDASTHQAPSQDRSKLDFVRTGIDLAWNEELRGEGITPEAPKRRTKEIARVLSTANQQGQNIALLLAEMPESDDESDGEVDEWKAAFAAVRHLYLNESLLGDQFAFFAVKAESTPTRVTPPSSLSFSSSSSLGQLSTPKSAITLVPETPPRQQASRSPVRAPPEIVSGFPLLLTHNSSRKSPDITRSTSIMSAWLSKASTGPRLPPANDNSMPTSGKTSPVRIDFDSDSERTAAREDAVKVKSKPQQAQKRTRDSEEDSQKRKKARLLSGKAAETKRVKEPNERETEKSAIEPSLSARGETSPATLVHKRDPTSYSRWLALANPRK